MSDADATYDWEYENWPEPEWQLRVSNAYAENFIHGALINWGIDPYQVEVRFRRQYGGTTHFDYRGRLAVISLRPWPRFGLVIHEVAHIVGREEYGDPNHSAGFRQALRAVYDYARDFLAEALAASADIDWHTEHGWVSVITGDAPHNMTVQRERRPSQKAYRLSAYPTQARRRRSIPQPCFQTG